MTEISGRWELRRAYPKGRPLGRRARADLKTRLAAGTVKLADILAAAPHGAFPSLTGHRH